MPSTLSPGSIHRRLLAVLGAAATLAFAGCGGDDETTDSASASTPSDATFPATVEHRYGTTTVEKKPERIAVVGYTEQDTVLALGYKPVAVTEWYGEQPYATWPWAQAALGDAKPTVLSASDGIQFEKLVETRPDLIIGTNSGMTKADYTKLSKIAPTIAAPKGGTDYFSPWEDQTMQVARALGKPAAAERLISDIKAKYAKVAAEHPEFAGKTATFSQNAFYEGKLYVYPDGLSTEFLTMLGLEITPGLGKYAPAVGQQAEFSAENVDKIDADVLVVAAEADKDIPALEKVGTYARLGAVKGKRTIYTDPILSGAIYFISPLSLPYVLDRLTPQLVNALAGKQPAAIVDSADPSTPETTPTTP